MPTSTFVSFFLDDQLFGLGIHMVREINKHLVMTPVPLAPGYIKGLVNLRGQVITVIDLKSRLGLGESCLSDVSHNIILKTHEEVNWHSCPEETSENYSMTDKAGLWVDNIGDIVTVEKSEIEPPPANAGLIDGKYLSGVVKLDNRLMTLISVPKVLYEKRDNA